MYTVKVFQKCNTAHCLNIHAPQSKALCLPFYAILLAMGNPTVDYFSLDVEGAELPILETIPWDKVNIKVMYYFIV